MTPELSSALTRRHNVRQEVKQAERQMERLREKIANPQPDDDRNLNKTTPKQRLAHIEKVMPALYNRLAEAEFAVEQLEAEQPVTPKVTSNVEAATGPEYETDDDLTIPPFLRRA